MIHKKRHPDWLLKEVLSYYPDWSDRTIKNTPYHLHGYSCGCRPLNWTGGPYRGWRELKGNERLLIDDPEMCGDNAGVWNPVWRLWEKPLKPGWTREIEDMLDMWSETGRTATPTEMGVPPELWGICDLEAEEAKNALIERGEA